MSNSKIFGQMTAQEYELFIDRAEVAYLRGEIDAMTFRQRMYAIGYSPHFCDDWLDELDRQKHAPT